jgi:hypothetical protein
VTRLTDGRYVYCILDWEENKAPAQFGNIGIMESPVYTVGYKRLAAAVSNIPFKQMESNLNDIVSHQRVVEAAHRVSTVLPVRFGVILKDEEGIKKLLATSYKDYGDKMGQLHGKDEIGIKVLLSKSSMKSIREAAGMSEDALKIKAEMSESKPGTSYFLKLRLDDSVKNETLKIIDRMAGEIHRTLGQDADQSKLLKNDIGEIILNASYLVDRNKVASFDDKLKQLRDKYETEGLTLHRSGPWAPYSFC